MYHYIKIRKKGNLSWKTVRDNGKILVFNNIENAKKYADSLTNVVYNIKHSQFHPMHNKSPIHGKRYVKMDW